MDTGDGATVRPLGMLNRAAGGGAMRGYGQQVYREARSQVGVFSGPRLVDIDRFVDIDR